jgi:hypothetical protein
MGDSDNDLSSALAQLAGHLEKASFRKSFAGDPDAALGMVGLQPDQFGELYETLAGLSNQELRALVTVRNALRDADIPTEIILEMV